MEVKRDHRFEETVEDHYWVLTTDGTLQVVTKWLITELYSWGARYDATCYAKPVDRQLAMRLDYSDRAAQGDGIWGNRDPGDRIYSTPGSGLERALERLGRARRSVRTGGHSPDHANQPEPREQERERTRRESQKAAEAADREHNLLERARREQERLEQERGEQQRHQQERAAQEAARRERKQLEDKRRVQERVYLTALATLNGTPELLEHHTRGRVPLDTVLRWRERDRVSGPAMSIGWVVGTLATCVASALIANSGNVGSGLIVMLTFAPLWGPLVFIALFWALDRAIERRRRRWYRVGDAYVSDEQLVDEYASTLDHRDDYAN